MTPAAAISMTPAPETLRQAGADLGGWLAAVRTPCGYGGPAVGARAACLSWCGPAADWRLEGILDAHGSRCAVAAGAEAVAALDALAADLATLPPALLADGSLRNSWFEFNPGEGGMPHEPAVLAAALRARRQLVRQGRPVPAGLDEAVARNVEERVLKILWNKQLQTFCDWPMSGYDQYSPPTVAAVIELLLEYGELAGGWPRLDHYLEGAAASLLAVQRPDGAVAGGLPLSNRNGAPCSPFLTARCLPALIAMRRRTGEPALAEAAAAAAAFVRRSALPGGGYPLLVHPQRPPGRFPVLTGAAAGTLTALGRAGLLEPGDLAAQLPWLLAHRQPGGAFATADGFGGGAAGLPAWRDVLPVTGWLDKLYALLALAPVAAAGGGAAGRPATVPPPVAAWSCEVRLGWRRRGRYVEEADTLRIEDARGRPLFRWRKGADWAEVNELAG